MAEDADWRHGKAHDYVDRLDPAGLAWEFLRRNRTYQGDYERIPKQKRESASDALTRLWGLRFPGFPDPSRHRCGYVNGGVKTGHGAEQKSATLGAGMRPAGGRSPSGGLIPALRFSEGFQPAFRARLWARR